MANIQEMREKYEISVEELSIKSKIPISIIQAVENSEDLKEEDYEIINQLARTISSIIDEQEFRLKRARLNKRIEEEIFREEKFLRTTFKWTLLSSVIAICYVVISTMFFNSPKIEDTVYKSNNILENLSKEIENKNNELDYQKIQKSLLELKKEIKEIKKEEKSIQIDKIKSEEKNIFLPVISLVSSIFLITIYTFIKKIRDEKEKFIDKLSVEQVINELEKDFINNLVKINIHQINSYNSQTKSQANKSFFIAMVAAIVGLTIVTFGLHLVYLNNVKPGYFVTGVGVLIEFIAGTVFYLYNKTVIKMGEYHKKLVLVQNIALSLKATEEFEGKEKQNIRGTIVQALLQDINKYLAER